jgi:phosphoglycolate phosphatase
MILFDFDGTLADTLPLFENFNEAHRLQFGLHLLTREKFRSLPLERAIQEMGLSDEKLPTYVGELKKFMRENLSRVKSFEGTSEALEKLKQAGHTLCILSSNSQESIIDFLQRENLTSYFSQIVGDAPVYEKHNTIRDLLIHRRTSPANTLYVGDEVRDFQACTLAGVPFLGIGWGWDDAKLLRLAGVKHLVDSPKELHTHI